MAVLTIKSNFRLPRRPCVPIKLDIGFEYLYPREVIIVEKYRVNLTELRKLEMSGVISVTED